MVRGSKLAPHSLVAQAIIDAMLKRACATPPGAWVEVGVYQGGTAWHLSTAAEAQGRALYLYDTFSGIPCKGPHDSHSVGDFADTSPELVAELLPNAHVVEGVFPRSALEMGPIAFVHLDCDQEESYRNALAYLGPRMVEGGIVWCDDVPCLAGALRAVSEFAASAGLRVETPEETGKAIIHF